MLAVAVFTNILWWGFLCWVLLFLAFLTLITFQFKDEMYPATEVRLGHLYAAISSYSSSWSRASVAAVLPDQKVLCRRILLRELSISWLINNTAKNSKLLI